MRYLTGGKPLPRNEVEEKVLPRYLWYYDTFPAWGFWAVAERSTGDFMGWFHLRPHPDGGKADEPELGYRLRRAAWGKGYATEGSRALVDKAFTDLGARRVFAETMTINGRSRRVMEKAGLRFIRTFHREWREPIPGDEHGGVEYAITRHEWEADRHRRDAPGGR